MYGLSPVHIELNFKDRNANGPFTGLKWKIKELALGGQRENSISVGRAGVGKFDERRETDTRHGQRTHVRAE